MASRRVRFLLVVATILVTIFTRTANFAQAASLDEEAVANFYSGTSIRVVVGLAPGGGFDLYSRLIARHIGKYIPGNPRVIVTNMPGAGSLIAANHVYNAAPRDGTVIANFNARLINQKLIFENPAVKFDPMQYNWLGALADTVACAVRVESGFTRLEEAFERELILGGQAAGSAPSDAPNILKAALGLKIKLIDGYKGTAEIRSAADRGEVHGGCWSWESIRTTWKEELEAGRVVVIGHGAANHNPDLKNVPAFLSLAKTDEAREMINAGLIIPSQILRAYALPPGVPNARLQAVRNAFAAALKDSALREETRRANLSVEPVLWREFHEQVNAMQKISPTVIKRLKNVLAK